MEALALTKSHLASSDRMALGFNNYSLLMDFLMNTGHWNLVPRVSQHYLDNSTVMEHMNCFNYIERRTEHFADKLGTEQAFTAIMEMVLVCRDPYILMRSALKTGDISWSQIAEHLGCVDVTSSRRSIIWSRLLDTLYTQPGREGCLALQVLPDGIEWGWIVPSLLGWMAYHLTHYRMPGIRRHLMIQQIREVIEFGEN